MSDASGPRRRWLHTLLRIFEWGTLGVVLLVAVAVYLFYNELRPHVIFGLRDDFAHAIPVQKVPTGIPSLKAEDCGKCHQEIYQEWKTSYHAQAYTDPFFRAYWKKDNEVWICLNCHTPLANQQPELIGEIPRNRVEKAVKSPNPDFDRSLQQEGITCAGCHVRDGVILGPFDDSVAPHPTKFDPKFRTAEICYRCHQVPKGPLQFYDVGPCGTFPEYE
jgi:Cytochrome c554 and c-prime